jgi:hypothetical protein
MNIAGHDDENGKLFLKSINRSSSELFVSSHWIVFLPFVLPFFSPFVLLSLVFFFDSLFSFLYPSLSFSAP